MTKIFRITTCAVLVLVLFLAAPAAMAADRDTGNQISAEHEIGLDWWAYLGSIWASLFDGPQAPEPPGTTALPLLQPMAMTRTAIPVGFISDQPIGAQLSSMRFAM